MIYRAPEIPCLPAPYRHNWKTKMRRAFQKFLSWKSQPLTKNQCMWCKRRFQPERQPRVFRDTSCVIDFAECHRWDNFFRTSETKSLDTQVEIC